jgi:hypothetical protein
MRMMVAAVAAVGLAALVGCIPEPMTRSVWLQPEIEDVRERVVSFRLKAANSVCGEEFVVFHGALANGPLNGTDEDASCFRAACLPEDEYRSGKCELWIRESRKAQRLALPGSAPRRPGAVLRVRAVFCDCVDERTLEPSGAEDSGRTPELARAAAVKVARAAVFDTDQYDISLQRQSGGWMVSFAIRGEPLELGGDSHFAVFVDEAGRTRLFRGR